MAAGTGRRFTSRRNKRREDVIAPGSAAALPVLPLSLFFALAALLAATLLYAGRRRRRFAGQLALAGLTLWAATTALLEWWRDETSLAGAPHLFEVAALSAAVCVPLVLLLTHRHRHEARPLA